jgi:flagellar assembly factor FliW
MMLLATTRFGSLELASTDLLIFSEGVIGFEELKLWTLLLDHRLAWLQSVERGEIALPVACPFHFAPEYRIRIAREDYEALHLARRERVVVLAVVNHQQRQWTVNLHAPILVNPESRLGRQIITLDEQPLRHILPRSTGVRRKTA